MDIKFIENKNIETIIPLLKILNDNISDEILANRLKEMIAQGYKCVGVYTGSKLIGICGIWVITKYYVGKHIEPDNMVFLPSHRSQGLGKTLMKWVHNYGLSIGCETSELNCYLKNTKSQKFWESEGYEKIAYHYQKSICPNK